MIPLAVPNLQGGREGEYLAECVTSTFVSSVGPFVGRFEAMVAEATGSPAAVATSAGTPGLQAALVAAGVQPGDLVVLPSMTFIASASAIHWSGATPWLMDVTRDSWTLDPAQFARALAEHCELKGGVAHHRATGRRVSAVVPVYTLGTPADMDPIAAAARAYGLAVVADAAAAVGATYKGRGLAEMGSDLGMISFNGNKTVTAGGGGAIYGADAMLVARAKHLTTTARVGADYLHDVIGFNYRMTNLQAAVGVAQMERWPEFLARKRAIRATYDAALLDLPDVTAFPQPAWAESACWFSGVVLEGRSEAEVTAVIAALRARDIDARPFWRPMHLQPPLAEAPREPTPVTDQLWYRVLTLPCSTGLTDDEQGRVVEAVRTVVRGEGRA